MLQSKSHKYVKLKKNIKLLLELMPNLVNFLINIFCVLMMR